MLKKFFALLMLCAMILSTGCAKDEQVERKEGEYQKIKLVMTCNGTNIATDSKSCQKFAELVSEASGGNVTIDAYASGVIAVLDEKLLICTVPWTFNNYQEARRINNGFRQITNGKHTVKTPEDVAGLKIRVYRDSAGHD